MMSKIKNKISINIPEKFCESSTREYEGEGERGRGEKTTPDNGLILFFLHTDHRSGSDYQGFTNSVKKKIIIVC